MKVIGKTTSLLLLFSANKRSLIAPQLPRLLSLVLSKFVFFSVGPLAVFFGDECIALGALFFLHSYGLFSYEEI
jgi:hypothetical protein